ncbi:MAG: hypothetical protein ACLR6I_16495 [Waltera sp.]
MKQIEGYDRTEVCMKNGNKLLISEVQVSGFCKSIFAIHFGGELNEPVRV